MGLFLVLIYYLIMVFYQKKVQKLLKILRKMDILYFLLKLPGTTLMYGQIALIIVYFKYKELEDTYMTTYILRRYLYPINNFKSI